MVARKTKHIQIKINDLRRLVKEKLTAIRRHASGTGGEPAAKISLTADELVIARCLDREMVEGLEGFDSVDQPLRTGKCVLSSFWCVACVGVGEHVTSVWVHQHVNVLCHPQMCRRELGRRRLQGDPRHPGLRVPIPLP